MDIRRFFAYPEEAMFQVSDSASHPFVIACKGCQRHIPAPVETLPSTWIIHTCPKCGETRRYLPGEIFQGRVSFDLLRKPVRSVGW